jgi:hypothetical protein
MKEKKEFNLQEFIESEGLHRNPEPYNYEAWLEVNPLLTKKMYDFLHGNGTTWKIACGKEVRIKWSNEVLKPVWWLDTPDKYQRRLHLWREILNIEDDD